MGENTANVRPHARGFVIATDALLALVVLFTILTLAFNAMQRGGSDAGIRQDLAVFAQYAGTTLEESGMVSRAAISNNTSEIRTFLSAWPSNRCGSVSVYSSPTATTPIFIVNKNECTFVSGEEESVQQGIIATSPPDANLVVAKVSVWVNQS